MFSSALCLMENRFYLLLATVYVYILSVKFHKILILEHHKYVCTLSKIAKRIYRLSQLISTNPCTQERESKPAMLAAQEVNRCHTEVNLRNPLRTCIHFGFETQGRLHQKSKSGVSVAPQKGHVLQK